MPRTYERWPIGDPQANPRNSRNLPFLRGLRGDVALRLPTYLDDWRDGFATKTVGATLFLYFACLAPVVAFGGAMQIATNGNLGIVETILSRGVCGMLYATFSGQPMTFVGPTGLTLTFTTALYAWAAPRGVPFLPMYSWVGLWTCLFLLTTACTNLAGLIRYCTRFTEDVFNAFLGTTYIWSAAKGIFSQLNLAMAVGAAGAAGAAGVSSPALLSLILCVLTLNLCQASSDLATSRYFSRRLRAFIADFGPACCVAIVSSLSCTKWVRMLAEVPRLAVPTTSKVALGRPLLVPLLSLPMQYRLMAMLPALFLAILFFLDQNITVRTVNSPANKLKPRATYHLDLAVLALLTGATSLCGLPWMCAATVESINHIRSMTVFGGSKGAPAKDKKKKDEARRRGGGGQDDAGKGGKPPEAAEELSEAALADLRMMFDSLDDSKTGAISSDKLVSLLRSRSLGEGMVLSTEEAARQAAGVLQRFDSSGDGKLQFDEFVELCMASARGETLDAAVDGAGGKGGGKGGIGNGNGGADASTKEDESVIETRLSGFLTHAMILATLGCVSNLAVVPIAVVNGVFFYLGRKVMQGNQFLIRLRALLVPLPLDLDTKSPAERSIIVLGFDAARTFTGLQLACLSTLWALKLTPGLGMVFPAAIGVLMFIRAQLLPRLFTRRQLGVVDTPIWSIDTVVKKEPQPVAKDPPPPVGPDVAAPA